MKRYAILSGLLALFLAACGGGVPPPPSSITLTVEDPMNCLNAAAYQVGSGPWQLLTMSGTATKTGTFSLGSQSQYGVAVRCNNWEVKVIQATASELPNPKLKCSSSAPSTVSFTVNVNVGIGFAPLDWVCVNGTGCVPASNSVSTTLNLRPGSQDLVVTLVDFTSGISVKAAKVVRNVNVIGGGNTSINLSNADLTSSTSLALPPPPGGYSPPSLSVLYLPQNGKGWPQVTVPPNAYRPVSGFAGGDFYYTELLSSNGGNGFLSHLRLFTTPPILHLPTPWPNGSLTVDQQPHPVTSGLSRTDPNLRAYRVYLQISGQIDYTATLSKGWLGAQTTYTLPNLSALLGYTPPTSSSSGYFGVSAILSNRSDLLALDPNNPMGLTNGDYVDEATAEISSYSVGGGTVTLP